MTEAKPAARAKRKRDEGGDGGGQEPEGSASQPLWRVNFEEFNCRLRYLAKPPDGVYLCGSPRTVAERVANKEIQALLGGKQSRGRY